MNNRQTQICFHVKRNLSHLVIRTDCFDLPNSSFKVSLVFSYVQTSQTPPWKFSGCNDFVLLSEEHRQSICCKISNTWDKKHTKIMFLILCLPSGWVISCQSNFPFLLGCDWEYRMRLSATQAMFNQRISHEGIDSFISLINGG